MPSALKILSLFVCLLVIAGYCGRRRKRLHITLMLSALAIDLGLVLYLELTRAVVESIPSRPLTPLLVLHITISVTVLVLYGIQLVTGINKARGRPSALHSKIPFWFITLRIGNLITSYFIS